MSNGSHLTETMEVSGELVSLDGASYYRISNVHRMPDFFMSLVGASDHWMFVSSSGALTAGRRDPDNALFPYAADDQVSLGKPSTGPITLIRDVSKSWIWEPFCEASANSDSVRRNLYKTPLGDKLVFEEIDAARQLAFRYRWVFSERFGLVRSCRLTNLANAEFQGTLVDGIQNVLPYGVSSEFMMRFSNLANAYKKSEFVDGSGIGLYYLSSIPTDRAEPSEGLMATTVWQSGLDQRAVALSTQQLAEFRAGGSLESELEVRGAAGAYLVEQAVTLAPGDSIDWHVVAEMEQDHCDVVALDQWLQDTTDPALQLDEDIAECEQHFLRILASCDAMQCGNKNARTNRHLSNTVFNVMRGGIPLAGYMISSEDFRKHAWEFNHQVAESFGEMLDGLPEQIDAMQLIEQIDSTGDSDLLRLASEYLPLAFSRRHGDPTRPWNRFSIQLKSHSGQTNLDYQGNWRDIFQNWEALAASFPRFTAAMICRFVNATTADGYNPYRLTKDGFEWEEASPEDPWANIGYWGDHQIIYLLKLLEWNRRVSPQSLDTLLQSQSFVHANIPYRIKPFDEIKQNPHDSIVFDKALADEITERVNAAGADGKLLRDQHGNIHRVTLMEKLLTLSLAKLSNFIPDGGIWLNTQRPEWNDANNALVGNGLSVVTTCYLYRWFRFLAAWLAEHPAESFPVSQDVAEFMRDISKALDSVKETTGARMSDSDRLKIVDALCSAGCRYRSRLYDEGPSGEATELPRAAILHLVGTAAEQLAVTIRNNRRADGLYHAYNLLGFESEGVSVEYLYEMLEGQVAVLSSGLLSSGEAVGLLDALRASSLYRENQDSYLLYPDRSLPSFLAKNTIDNFDVSASPLLSRLIDDSNTFVVNRDVRGDVHFNGSLRNSSDLLSALASLPKEYQSAVGQEKNQLVDLFESLFDHRRFTGRSGTFFAYEGLGSIYWHMVSKLGLAVVENFFSAIDSGDPEELIARLRDHFQVIRRGIGAEKSPLQYGAFPSDPYSHTPENRGVKQPGMTGQVKEDILSRFAEVGAHVEGGHVRFRFDLMDRDELLADAREFCFFKLNGKIETIRVPKDAFLFSFCQVPIVCHGSDICRITVSFHGGEQTTIDGLTLDRDTSDQLFSRTGQIDRIDCYFKK